jgi:hypothetical protein
MNDPLCSAVASQEEILKSVTQAFLEPLRQMVKPLVAEAPLSASGKSDKGSEGKSLTTKGVASESDGTVEQVGKKPTLAELTRFNRLERLVEVLKEGIGLEKQLVTWRSKYDLPEEGKLLISTGVDAIKEVRMRR